MPLEILCFHSYLRGQILLMQTGWNCCFTRKGTRGPYQSLWSQSEFLQKRIHWSVPSHSLACLLLTGTVMSAWWEISLVLWELWGHWDNFPQSNPSITPPPSRHIPESACPAAKIQCLCQLSLSRGLDATCDRALSLVTILLPLESFSICCCNQLCCSEKQTLQCRGAWKSQCCVSIPQVAAQVGCRNLCAQTLGHDSLCDKYQLQTLQCVNNLFWPWTSKNKVSSIYLFTFGLFCNS